MAFKVNKVLQIRMSSLRKKVGELWRRALHLQRPPRRLRLCETLPLGERRFVAVIEFEQSRFLLGGTSSSLVLLSRLEETGNQSEEERRVTIPFNPPGGPIMNRWI
jgi:flagellar biogenesis protein FliO